MIKQKTTIWTKMGQMAGMAGLVAMMMTLTSGRAHAEAIEVENYSFELPAQSETSDQEQYTLDEPPAWTRVGGVSTGVDRPAESMFSAVKGKKELPAPAQGFQFGYLNIDKGGALTAGFIYSGKSLGQFVAGKKYTLTVAVGCRKGWKAPTYSIVLQANGKAVGHSVLGSPRPDSFVDVVYTYTATADDAGREIGIFMWAFSNADRDLTQATFDNVRLTVE